MPSCRRPGSAPGSAGASIAPGRTPLEVCFSPERTEHEVREQYRDATTIEPLPEGPAPANRLPEVDASNEIDSSDTRRTCRQCANLSPGGRCLAAWRGLRIGNAGRDYSPVPDVPRRCEGYAPRTEDRPR